MTDLLDVNLLISLAWPNHVHHASALAWFGARDGQPWATSPVTEAGFVRVSSNPSAIRAARRAAPAEEPPSTNGGRGRRYGRGVTVTVVPRYSNGSPVQAFFRTSTPSVWRRTRSPRSLPNMANSRPT